MVKRERERREQSGDSQARALMHTCESGTRALVYFNRVQKKKQRKKESPRSQRKKGSTRENHPNFMFQIQKDQVKPPLEFFFHDRRVNERGSKRRSKCASNVWNIYISRGEIYEMRVKNQKPIETILTYRGNDLKRERKTGKSLVGGGLKVSKSWHRIMLSA